MSVLTSKSLPAPSPAMRHDEHLPANQQTSKQTDTIHATPGTHRTHLYNVLEKDSVNHRYILFGLLFLLHPRPRLYSALYTTSHLLVPTVSPARSCHHRREPTAVADPRSQAGPLSEYIRTPLAPKTGRRWWSPNTSYLPAQGGTPHAASTAYVEGPPAGPP